MGVPLGYVGTVRAVGWELGAWAVGRERRAEEPHTAAQVGVQRGFQVFGKPGVMAIRRGGRQEAGGRIPSTSGP